MTDPSVDAGVPPGAERFEVVRHEGGAARTETIPVVRETACSLYVNRFELVTWMCTPLHLDRLAYGFLLNERVIESKADIASLRLVEEERTFIDIELANPDVKLPTRRILTSGCTGGVTFEEVAKREERVVSDAVFEAEDVVAAVAALLAAARLYKETRGVHTSALADRGGRLLAVEEDVGRHNTLDKIRGACALEGIDPAGRMLVSTGRISSEMLSKAARMRCPVVASRTSPTALSVRLARSWGITVAGYVRRGAFTVYAHPQRIRSAPSAGP
jgi:FdhD protein